MLFFFVLFLDDDANLLFCARAQAVSGAAPPLKISLFGLFQARDTKEVIAPQKDNTLRTTHTQYVCRPVVVHLRAQQFVVPIKNAKDHQFEESSKMPPFSGTFCFVLCIYRARRRALVVSSSLLREEKANFLPSRSRCIRAFARHALLIPSRSSFRCTFIIYDIIIIIATGSSQRLRGL